MNTYTVKIEFHTQTVRNLGYEKDNLNGTFFPFITLSHQITAPGEESAEVPYNCRRPVKSVVATELDKAKIENFDSLPSEDVSDSLTKTEYKIRDPQYDADKKEVTFYWENKKTGKVYQCKLENIQ